MTDATRRLSVRLSVDGAQQARQELTRTGETGDQALARIVGGAQRASSALNLLGIGLGALSVGALANFARRAVDALGVVAMEVVPPGLSWEAVVATPSTGHSEPRMDSHENARTTPRGRMLMIERLRSGWAVADVAAAMGVTSKTVRKWRDRFAAVEVGLRNEELDRGLAALTRRIGDAATGGRQAEEAFRRIGVAFLDASGNARATEGVLTDIADRIAAVENPAERARVATEIFGDRLGQRLIPFLAQGCEGLERLTAEALRFGQIADAELIAAADEAADKINKLGEAFGRLATRIVAEAAPALTIAATVIERAVFGVPVAERVAQLEKRAGPGTGAASRHTATRRMW